MASTKYHRPHRRERKRWAPVVAAGRAYCAEPVCVIEQAGGTRWILPGSRWHLSHDAATGAYIGPSHGRCNEAENARRNNPKRAQRPKRLAL